jgi:hypothetical protein
MPLPKVAGPFPGFFYGTNGPWFQLPASSLARGGSVRRHITQAFGEQGARDAGSESPVVLYGPPEPYAAEHGTHVEEVRVR